MRIPLLINGRGSKPQCISGSPQRGLCDYSTHYITRSRSNISRQVEQREDLLYIRGALTVKRAHGSCGQDAWAFLFKRDLFTVGLPIYCIDVGIAIGQVLPYTYSTQGLTFGCRGVREDFVERIPPWPDKCVSEIFIYINKTRARYLSVHSVERRHLPSLVENVIII